MYTIRIWTLFYAANTKLNWDQCKALIWVRPQCPSLIFNNTTRAPSAQQVSILQRREAVIFVLVRACAPNTLHCWHCLLRSCLQERPGAAFFVWETLSLAWMHDNTSCLSINSTFLLHLNFLALIHGPNNIIIWIQLICWNLSFCEAGNYMLQTNAMHTIAFIFGALSVNSVVLVCCAGKHR